MSPALRRCLLVVVPLAVAAGLAWLLLIRSGDGRSTSTLVAERRAELARCLRERASEAAGGERECPGAPESSADLLKIGESVSSRLGSGDGPRALSRGIEQRNRLRARARQALIPGTGGTWAPYGKGPLRFDDDRYPASFGDGFGRVNGRVNDLLYVAQTKRLYAAVAQGGVWESTDTAKSWHPIGDTLPIGSTGAIGWTAANGGTLIVATGDHAFSNDYAGVGVYWSTDDGVTWVKAKGAPDGALAYRVAVDPTDPQTVYVATGLGLFRSTDAGRSFTNVKLPTGDCAGDSLKPNCFFASIVTDVAVQPADSFGHKGGAVLATVGWRAGQRQNFNGKPESPNNGVYRSDTGAPGSFSKIDGTGYPGSDIAGRAELGVATGPGQDANYVYAMVQDWQAFAKQAGGENDIPLVGTPSVLEGLYVSKDFGKTWTRLARREDFYNPANGSTLSQLTAAGIGPGYQVTYNQWIKPDPTRTGAAGVPTRLLFGMEEVWSSAIPGQPQDGSAPDQFHVFGQYTANGGTCLVIPEGCGAKQNATPSNTTTHPDQHGNAIVPDATGGGLTLVVSNDGGVYSQHAAAGEEFGQDRWGTGNNEGFYTLLPYGVAVAKDGVAYAGLQDNGQLKIHKDGTQSSVYVGDGIYAMVDPDNSDINYDELPNAGINVSTDGGVSYADISPSLSQPDFVAPMVMDPGDAKHIMTGGREIVESTAGPDTTSSSWTTVYDLGTQQHPGDKDANRPQGDPVNGPPPPDPADPYSHAISMQVLGDDVYVGFCGSCDPVKLKQKFKNGIATNVGGAKPGKRLTGDGWHIAAARGLPNRFPTSVTMDPRDHRTVYVTLGASAARYFAPLGAQGDDAVGNPAGGYVYKSTDAGETFKDITGDLPKVQATWSIVRNGRLIVANAVGVFSSRGTDGGAYVPLGSGLPPVATYSMTLKPGDPNTLVAATFGRGVYRYTFADPTSRASRPGPGCRDRTAPASKFKRTARTASARRKLTLRGTATDRGCGSSRRGTVKRVRVSIARITGRRCRSMTSRGRLSRKRTSCRKTSYVTVKGTTRWSFTARRPLPKGTYQIWVRGIDAAGNVEKKSRKRNFRRLRLR